MIAPHQTPAAEWSSLCLEGRIVNTLAQNEMFLYAGTDQGIYRRSLSPQDDWVLLGLEGDIVTDIFIDPFSSNTLYAGIGLKNETNPPGDDVTLYKSTDGGATWSPSDNGMHGLSAHTVVGRPDNPSVLYAAGVQHLSRSLDAGSTWTLLFHASFSNSLAMAPSNPDVMYLAGCSISFAPSLWKSGDAGENWTEILLSINFGSIFVVAVDPFDPEVVYAPLNAGILKSVDGGENISFILVGLNIKALIIDPMDSDRLYAGGQAAVLKSRDGGETWTDLEGPGGAGEVRALLLDRGDPNILYAGTSGSGVFMVDVSDRITSVNSPLWTRTE